MHVPGRRALELAYCIIRSFEGGQRVAVPVAQAVVPMTEGADAGQREWPIETVELDGTWELVAGDHAIEELASRAR